MSEVTFYSISHYLLLKLSSASSVQLFSWLLTAPVATCLWFALGEASLLFRHNDTWMAAPIQTSLFFLQDWFKEHAHTTKDTDSTFFMRRYNHSSVVVWEFWHPAEVRSQNLVWNLLQACNEYDCDYFKPTLKLEFFFHARVHAEEPHLASIKILFWRILHTVDAG